MNVQNKNYRMSVQEVTRLRREGKYEEAYVLSQKEWEEDQQDIWKQMSYFWSIHGLCKEVLIRQGRQDDAKQLLPDMERLLPTMAYGGPGSTGETCYNALLRSLLPHADVVQRCSARAKEDPNGAYQEIVSLPFNEIDPQLHEQYGWVLYWYMRHRMSQKVYAAKELTDLCKRYSQLHISRPSQLHSSVLWYVVRFAKQNTDFKITQFWKDWGAQAQLRKEDWQPSKKDAKEFRPFVEDVAAQLCAEFEDTEENVQYLKDFYKSIVRRINANADEHTLRIYARLCVKSNDVEEARKIYMNLILKTDAPYYVWHEYAKVVESNDVRIGLLLKALSLQSNEDYQGKIHLDLAEALIQAHFLEDAEEELRSMGLHYKQRGWKIPPRAIELARSCTDKTNSRILERDRYVALAEDSVFASFPAHYGYVDYVNEAKQTLHIIDVKSNMLFYKYRGSSLREGDFVLFRIRQNGGAFPGVLIAMLGGKQRTSESKIVSLRRTMREEALSHFPKCTVVVDNVNEDKQLFHVRGHGFNEVVRFRETRLRPCVGDVLSITFCRKEHKGRRRAVFLEIDESAAVCDDLKRTVKGRVTLHFASPEGDVPSAPEPVHGFIEHMYIPKKVLQQGQIREECYAEAKAIVEDDGRWRVYEIREVEEGE